MSQYRVGSDCRKCVDRQDRVSTGLEYFLSFIGGACCASVVWLMAGALAGVQ